MSETSDNLTQVASEETTTSTVQVGGEETNTAASQETTAQSSEEMKAEIDRLRKQVENQNKLIGRKAVDMQTLKALGLAKEEEVSTQTVTQPAQTAQAGRSMAQQFGGSELEAWFEQARQTPGVGTAGAIQAMLATYMPQMLNQYLAPVNEQLTTAKERVNQAALKEAVAQLQAEFDDAIEKAEAINQYWKDNPKKRELLKSADTTAEEKYDLLETAYLKVSRIKSTNATAAAKAAGAMDAKQREQMVNSSTTSAGAKKAAEGAKTLEDAWAESMQSHEKGNRLKF